MAPLKPLDHDSFSLRSAEDCNVFSITSMRAKFRFSVHVHEIQ